MASVGAYQTALPGANNAFIAKFMNTGTGTTSARIWGTYLGGAGTELANAIAYDPLLQRLAVAGNTTSVTGLSTANSFQPVYGGGTQDAFLFYGDTAGAVKWITYYGGSSLDYGQGACFDRFGNAMICGGTFSTTGIATTGSYQPALAGNYDAYFARFNTLGQLLWGTYFGDIYYDYANSIFYNPLTDQVTLGGFTTSTANITTPATFQPAYGGGIYDGFITEFAPDTFAVINQPYIDTLVCAGGPFTVSYTVYTPTAAFQPGNVFSVEMSDNTGVFGSGTAVGIIGTLTATGSGTISCTIPAGVAPGTGYRIRIDASTPAYNSPDDYYNIRVTDIPLPASVAVSNTPVCAGASIFLHDVAPYAVSSYTWYGPDGFFNVVPNPIILGATLANAGTYTVTPYHNGCGATPTVTTTGVVNDFTPPTPSDSAGLACNGRTLYLFSNADTSASEIIYKWSGPAGFSSSLQNPVITTLTFCKILGDYQR